MRKLISVVWIVAVAFLAAGHAQGVATDTDWPAPEPAAAPTAGGVPLSPDPGDLPVAWWGSYEMFWDVFINGDALFDGDGRQTFRPRWRFSLGSSGGSLLTPTITAEWGTPPFTINASKVESAVTLTLTQTPLWAQWSRSTLDPVTGGSITGDVSTNPPVSETYRLGYDVERELVEGRYVEGGAVNSPRTFTFTFKAHDTTLLDIGASIDFTGQGPNPRHVSTSDLVCNDEGVGWLRMAPGPVFWKIGEGGYPPLEYGRDYTLICTFKVTNDSSSPALFMPSIVVSGRRILAPKEGSGFVTYTSGEQPDPPDPLGATVTFAAGANDAEAALTVIFTRTVILNGMNALVLGPPTLTASPITAADGNVTVSGTGAPYAMVSVFDGLVQIRTVFANYDGAWTINRNFLVGAHPLTARQSSGGQTSEPSATVTVYHPPPAPGITGPSSVVSATSPATVTLNGYGFYDGGQTPPTGSTVTIFEGATPIGTTVVRSNGRWSATVALAYGAHELTASQTLAGATSALSSPFVVTVVRDSAPPVISSVIASPGVLWPANHKMVAVALAVTASDNVTPVPVCRVVSVTTNEPPNGTGDGNTLADFAFDGLNLSLRAERSGKLTGRIYTVAVVCTDEAGNDSTPKTATVVVPHDLGKGK